MAKKSRWQRFVRWLGKKFGRSKMPDGVDHGCNALRNSESRLEGEIAAIEAEGGNASHQRGELNTVREGMEHLGC
ncbi:hypothetical protein [Pseudarthrobacter siccitolerans]